MGRAGWWSVLTRPDWRCNPALCASGTDAAAELRAPAEHPQVGEEQAAQLGLNAEQVKGFILLAASLTTAAAVAFSGVIGFIGLIVPHVIRLIWGHDYRRLIPLSILGGGTALLAADLLARTVLAPQVIPVGIVTALAGAPFSCAVYTPQKSGILVIGCNPEVLCRKLNHLL